MKIIIDELTMVADSFYIPKKNPAKPHGEDAHFFDLEAQVIGVADGIGGWARQGIDAGEYARELMRNAADAVSNSRPAAVDPKSVLTVAFAKTAAAGSSTACIISLAGHRLRAANVGHSGFAVIRRGRAIYRSPVQKYRFDSPYQLGTTVLHGPERASELAVEMKIGNVVVAGTDGIFDNLFLEDIEEIVERCYGAGMSPAMVARELATAAHANSLDCIAISPFEVAAYKAGIIYIGGKIDDITVVVAYVVPSGIKFD